MDNYNQIADELEKLAEFDSDQTLDKIAAAALLYQYSSLGDRAIPLNDDCLVKMASKKTVEADVAAEIGIKAALRSMMNMEV